MKAWITRTRPAAERTAAHAAALGWESVTAPLLAIQPLPQTELSLHGVRALAFTSAHGVAAFAGRQPGGRDLPVFTVGDATARAAQAAGFADVRSAAGDVTALAHLIAASGVRGPVLHPRAERPAGDLAGELGGLGVELRPVTTYRATALPMPAEADAAWPELRAVLLHSPRAARALADAVATRPTGHLFAACISEAAASPLRGLFSDLRIAERPDEAALLRLLGKAEPTG